MAGTVQVGKESDEVFAPSCELLLRFTMCFPSPGRGAAAEFGWLALLAARTGADSHIVQSIASEPALVIIAGTCGD